MVFLLKSLKCWDYRYSNHAWLLQTVFIGSGTECLEAERKQGVQGARRSLGSPWGQESWDKSVCVPVLAVSGRLLGMPCQSSGFWNQTK